MIVALTAVLSTIGHPPHSFHSRRKWLRGALAPTSCCLGSVRSCHSCAAAAAAMALSYLLLLLLFSPRLSVLPHISHSRRKWLRGAVAPSICCLGDVHSSHSCRCSDQLLS